MSLAPLMAFGQSDDQYLSKFRADFPKACAEAPVPPGVSQQQVLQLCECTADEMARSFSVADLKRVEEQQVMTDDEESKVADIGRACAISTGIAPQS
jgi:hypothetical protein